MALEIERKFLVKGDGYKAAASGSVRSAYENWFRTSTAAADRLMLRYQVDHVDISTNEDYVRGLLSLFHRR